MREIKRPVVFKTQLLGKDMVVTVTAKTIAFRQKHSKQNLVVVWLEDIIKRFYKL